MLRLLSIIRAQRSLFASLVVSALLTAPMLMSPATVHAIVPGYNGKIAFVSTRDGNDEIYAMNADGTNQTRLTTNLATDKDPSWSPDGTRLAFTSSRDGNNEIYVMHADGSNTQRLTNNPASDNAPQWSPDGTTLTFQSMRDGNYEIYRMDVDGSNPIRLTTDPGNDQNARWLSDGTRLLFQSTRTGHTEIYSMKPDGSDLRKITNHTYSSTTPAPAPDGETIVYTDGMIGGNSELYQINMDGTSPVRLTANADNDVSSVYAPDGKLIAFHRSSGGVNYIYTMKADGTEEMPLTNAGADGRAPDWQPIPNTAPVTVKDALSTPINVAASVDVLANDTDEEALSGSHLTIATQPAHGTATITDGKVTFTPASDYVGTDQLTYTICDSFLLDQKCATGVLGITVSAGPVPVTSLNRIGTLKTVASATTYYYTGHRPTFAGTATPRARITVEIHSDPIVLTTTADGDGNWQVTPDQDLPSGDHTVTITATKDGATSTPLRFVLGINSGLAETGAPLWPLSAVGIFVLFGTRWYLKRRTTA